MEAFTQPQPWLDGESREEMMAGTSFTYRVIDQQYAGKVTMSLRDIKYDPTRTLVKMLAQKAGLTARAFRSWRELCAMKYFADGFVADTTGQATIDGAPLFYDAHPYSESNQDDTYSNRLSGDPSLNPTSYQNAWNLFASQTASNGWEFIEKSPMKLLANKGNREAVKWTLYSPMDYRTANNTPNQVPDDGITPVFSPYFQPEPSAATSTGVDYPGWVLLTGAGFYMKDLEGFQSMTKVDEETRMFMLMLLDDFTFSNNSPGDAVGSLGG
jgi:hypothetical protein